MNYRVITTLGPACRSRQLWEELVAAGSDTFRLNTSHTTLGELAGWISDYASFSRSFGRVIPFVLDLQGSKWRLGELNSRVVQKGEQLKLIQSETSAQVDELPIPHPDFFRAVRESGAEVILNDAKVRLRVLRQTGNGVATVVTQAGPLASKKGVTLSDSPFRIEELQAKDAEIVALTRDLPGIYYAVSYVRDAVEMARYRCFIGDRVRLAAKIERRSSINSLNEIASLCDEIWICRGDLGAELGMKGMAEEVQRMLAAEQPAGKPVILAGQVLEHMVHSATPTRSELCHLYNCLCSGIDGFVLSDECAIGDHPVLATQHAAMFR
ncbi:MAG: hypothetical protein CR997_08930 [Acidobacteria bacterium]|nr:MAG: hypothetical protein CR997_08930 [Acidobacteriota bacterium]